MDIELTAQEKELQSKIQAEIAYCLNCQARDSREWIWVQGEESNIEDLFDSYEVDEDTREKLIVDLQCLNCGNDIARYDDIGLEEDFEAEKEEKLKQINDQYKEKIQEMESGIKSFPLLALTFPLAQEIFDEISKNKIPYCSISGIFYRTRIPDGSKVLDEEGMLAPPLGKSTEGRFNHAGQNHLYISENKETAIREILKSQEPALIWIQEIEVSKIENILDLSFKWDNVTNSPSKLLIALHDSQVLMRSKGNKEFWRPDYTITRFIMDCAKSSNYNGIKYNSSESFEGVNIVLFELDKNKIVPREKPDIVISDVVIEKERKKNYASDIELPF